MHTSTPFPTPVSSTPSSRIVRPTHSAHTPSSSLGHLELSSSFAAFDEGLDSALAQLGSENGQTRSKNKAYPAQETAGVDATESKARGAQAAGESDSSTPSSPTSPKLRKRRSSSVSLVVPAPHVPQLDALIEDDADESGEWQDVRAPPPNPESARKHSPKKAPRATYIAPHLRGGSSPSYALKTLSLNSLDNSALPEPEDNFYSSRTTALNYGTRDRSSTNASVASSLGSAFSMDENASPTGARHRFAGGRAKSTNPYSIESSPPPAMSLINRGPYTHPDKFAHPHAIQEDDEDDVEEEEDYPAPRRSRQSSCQSHLFVSSRRASIVEPPPPGFVEDRFVDSGADSSNSGPEDVCTSCGADAVASFVALMPCDHLLCHVCVNALVNAAAHKPPRPLDCFFCGGFVESFLPAWEGVGVPDPESTYEGQRIGLVEALFLAYKDQRQEQHAKACAQSPRKGGGEGGGRRKGREPVSLVDLGRNLSDHFQPLNFSPREQQPMPALRPGQRSIWDTSPTTAGGAAAAVALFNNAPMGSARGSPSDQLASAREALVASPDASRLSRHSGGRRSRSNSVSSAVGAHSADTSLMSLLPELENGDSSFALSAADDGPGTPPRPTAGAGINLTQLNSVTQPKPSEWPVVRLDNIPWDVTTAEVEDWLPSGTLPSTEDCVLAVHILCNRADGRTLNQCYVEAASLEAARRIVRSRDGRKLRKRPVHVTLNGQGEFLTTIFPTYDPGFTGHEANKGAMTCPILMQTELTGLLTLCKLQSSHSHKVKERPYFNIVTILQKFPWYQPDTYNSQQIVRLFNTACAAVEILGAVRSAIPEWLDILTVLAEAVIACPVFRPAQKTKFLRKAGVPHTVTPGSAETKFSSSSTSPLFSPPALQERFVSVSVPDHLTELTLRRLGNASSAFPDSFDMDADDADDEDDNSPHQSSPTVQRASAQQQLKTAQNWRQLDYPQIREAPQIAQDEEEEDREPTKRHRRSSSSIARELGVDQEMIRAVALQLGLRG